MFRNLVMWVITTAIFVLNRFYKKGFPVYLVVYRESGTIWGIYTSEIEAMKAQGYFTNKFGAGKFERKRWWIESVFFDDVMINEMTSRLT